MIFSHSKIFPIKGATNGGSARSGPKTVEIDIIIPLDLIHVLITKIFLEPRIIAKVIPKLSSILSLQLEHKLYIREIDVLKEFLSSRDVRLRSLVLFDGSMEPNPMEGSPEECSTS